MNLCDIEFREFSARLAAGRALVSVGPFNICYQSNYRPCAANLYELYANNPILDGGFIDVWMACRAKFDPHAPWRRRVEIFIDGRFDAALRPPLLATPGLEWSLNLAIATRAHEYMTLHAASLEKNGCGLIMPAPPGSGKSTLAAALDASGWRLFSDEFALINPTDGELQPIPRPVSLKNESIGIIRKAWPERVATHEFSGTVKGRVGYYLPRPRSIEKQNDTATPAILVRPEWRNGAAPSVERMSQTEAFGMLTTNAVNADFFGEDGFNLFAQMARSTPAYSLVYSQIKDAIAAMNDLVLAPDVARSRP